MMFGQFFPFKFFIIFPIICIMIFLIRSFFFKKYLSPFRQLPFSLNKTLQASLPVRNFEKPPEELVQAGQKILESLDWEIRFWEKQLLEAKDVKQRKEIEEKLRLKKAEYQSVIHRLS